MATLKILRVEHSETEGNRGIALYNGEFFGHTIECPEKYNSDNVSRIPAGTYIAKKQISSKFGLRWYVKNVPNRTSIILFHKGNTAKSFQGCIGVGDEWHVNIGGQRGVTNTTTMCDTFMSITAQENELTVIIENI
jgi:hypothetical protein